MCIYVICSFAFQSIEFGRFMDTNDIDNILCHGDRMYLHALTIKTVPDANSLPIEELPEVVTSQNNVEYRLNYNKFYQGRIDRSHNLTLLGPLYMSSVIGLARSPGRILCCVHMGNFSPVNRDEFKKHNQNGGT